jgi:hypothetical protein
MYNKREWARCVGMVLGLVVMLLIVSSCANPEKRILGKWISSVSSLNVLTFREDGTFEYSIPGEKLGGTYRVEGTQLQLRLPAEDLEGVMEFEVSDGRLTLKGSGVFGIYFGGVWVRPQ